MKSALALLALTTAAAPALAQRVTPPPVAAPQAAQQPGQEQGLSVDVTDESAQDLTILMLHSPQSFSISSLPRRADLLRSHRG